MCRVSMEEERLFPGGGARRYGALAARGGGAAGAGGAGGREEYIRHRMQHGDTLQGLALKYQVTTEKIRRANRMFATDSLFLRESLLIPVTKDSPFYDTAERVTQLPPPNHRASIAEMPSHQFVPGSPDEKKSFDDFLNRVDSSLADIKKHVEKTKENSEFVRDLEDGFVRHRPTARLRQSASLGGVGGPSTSDAPLVALPPPPVVLTQGRRVKSSLQRLERTQDELFQL